MPDSISFANACCSHAEPKRPDHKIVDRTKIRDGAVANRPVYVAIGINLEGERDVLGMWVGTGGGGAKVWMTWLAELKNRGVQARPRS